MQSAAGWPSLGDGCTGNRMLMPASSEFMPTSTVAFQRRRTRPASDGSLRGPQLARQFSRLPTNTDSLSPAVLAGGACAADCLASCSKSSLPTSGGLSRPKSAMLRAVKRAVRAHSPPKPKLINVLIIFGVSQHGFASRCIDDALRAARGARAEQWRLVERRAGHSPRRRCRAAARKLIDASSTHGGSSAVARSCRSAVFEIARETQLAAARAGADLDTALPLSSGAARARRVLMRRDMCQRREGKCNGLLPRSRLHAPQPSSVPAPQHACCPAARCR